MADIETPVSKISGGAVVPAFRAQVLGKYDVQYYRCLDTGFIQTETPYWLDEAYASAISALDVGYVGRNVAMSATTEQMIQRCFANEGRFLDYGGGYGMFVRLMRDKGFDFVRYDLHCTNLFAIYFDASEKELNGRSFELVTAFEVFEHLPEPIVEVERMFRISDSILFSTELLSGEHVTSARDWWYFIPETGQHVAFYTLESLNQIASRFGAQLYSNGHNLHLMTKRRDVPNPFAPKSVSSASPTLIKKIVNKCLRLLKGPQPPSSNPAPNPSRLNSDFELILNKIRATQISS